MITPSAVATPPATCLKLIFSLNSLRPAAAAIGA